MHNPCTCMGCINQLASKLALHPRIVVYPRTGPAREPDSLPEPKARGRGDAAWTDGFVEFVQRNSVNGRQKVARW